MSDPKNPFRHEEEEREALARMYDLLSDVHGEVKRTNGRVTVLETRMDLFVKERDIEKVERVAYLKGKQDAPLLTRKHLAALVTIVTAAGVVAGNAVNIAQMFL